MTKQYTTDITAPVSDLSGTGAPATSLEKWGEQNALLRAAPPLGSFGADLLAAGASQRGPYQEPVVRVLVLGVPLLLPEHAVCAGLSHLHLTTEVDVPLDRYAEGVALVLSALARHGIVTVSA